MLLANVTHCQKKQRAVRRRWTSKSSQQPEATRSMQESRKHDRPKEVETQEAQDRNESVRHTANNS